MLTKTTKNMIFVAIAFVMLIVAGLACTPGSCDGQVVNGQCVGRQVPPDFSADDAKVAPASTAVHNFNKDVEDKVAPKVVAPVQHMVATVVVPVAPLLKKYDVGCDCYK